MAHVQPSSTAIVERECTRLEPLPMVRRHLTEPDSRTDKRTPIGPDLQTCEIALRRHYVTNLIRLKLDVRGSPNAHK